MTDSFDMNHPAAALAAPTDPSIIHIQSLVIAATSLLSLLGAAWIMASFVVRFWCTNSKLGI